MTENGTPTPLPEKGGDRGKNRWAIPADWRRSSLADWRRALPDDWRRRANWAAVVVIAAIVAVSLDTDPEGDEVDSTVSLKEQATTTEPKRADRIAAEQEEHDRRMARIREDGEKRREEANRQREKDRQKLKQELEQDANRREDAIEQLDDERQLAQDEKMHKAAVAERDRERHSPKSTYEGWLVRIGGKLRVRKKRGGQWLPVDVALMNAIKWETTETILRGAVVTVIEHKEDPEDSRHRLIKVRCLEKIGWVEDVQLEQMSGGQSNVEEEPTEREQWNVYNVTKLWQDNEIKARDKWGGEHVRFYGDVERVRILDEESALPRYAVDLDGAGIWSVEFQFSRDHKKMIEGLNSGDRVTIEGMCSRKSSGFGVTVRNCFLVRHGVKW